MAKQKFNSFELGIIENSLEAQQIKAHEEIEAVYKQGKQPLFTHLWMHQSFTDIRTKLGIQTKEITTYNGGSTNQ